MLFICFLMILLLLILFIKNIHEKFDNKKYITYNCNASAGLSHQTSNLKYAIKEAYYSNKILVIPKFNLNGKHNNGIEIVSNLSKYYDYNKLKVNGKKYYVELDQNVKNIEKINIKKNLFRIDSNIKHSQKNLDIDLPYNKNIIDISNDISSQLGKFICIHIRRGDMLHLKKNLDNDTGSQNILPKLKKYKNHFDNIYIMTNEKNLNMYNDLRNLYKNRLFFKDDFPKLNKIQDNYYLFCIENCIMDNANIKISTFKTDKKNYYNDYLSEEKGYQ